MFLHYINAFRVIAIFFIVAVHTIHVFSWSENSDHKHLLDVLFNNGTIFFIFISGYLFQHLSHQFNAKKYYASKLKNVILPYIIISIPAVLYFALYSQKAFLPSTFYEMPISSQILHFYTFGYHLSPMWFIPVITLYYILGPALIQLDKTKVFYYLLPVFITASYYFPRGLLQNNFIHFFSIYMLGMFSSKFKAVINPILSHKNVLWILLTISLGLINYEYLAKPQLHYVNYLQKLCIVLLFVGVLFKFNHHLNQPFIDLVAETSFGVFFVHPYILACLKFCSGFISQSLNLTTPRISGNLFFHFITSLLTLGISILLVVLIIRFLKSKSYLLVGNVRKRLPPPPQPRFSLGLRFNA